MENSFPIHPVSIQIQFKYRIVKFMKYEIVWNVLTIKYGAHTTDVYTKYMYVEFLSMFSFGNLFIDNRNIILIILFYCGELLGNICVNTTMT